MPEAPTPKPRTPATLRTRRRGSTHAPPETRRAQILRSALACFANSGFTRATMDDVAAHSGLSKGSLYRFFSSKDEILLALFDDFETAVLGILDEKAAHEGALALLERTGEAASKLLAGEPGLLQTWPDFFVHPDSRERLRKMYVRARRRLAAVIRAGIETGEIRPVDPGDSAAGLVAVVEGLLLQAMVDSRFDPRRRWPGVWALVEPGLRN